jgi:hypothetical protein
MKIAIHWRPELGGVDASTRDEDGLRELFGSDETKRILAALEAVKGASARLTVNGPDAGFLDLDVVNADFRVLVRRHERTTVEGDSERQNNGTSAVTGASI